MKWLSYEARPEISIVVPCYNEELVLPATAARLRAVAELFETSFEIVYVDDGSRDRTAEILAELQRSDPHVRVVCLARNFGHQIALTAGLEHASGAAVVVIDADLQDPPEVILELIARWREGYDVVYGTRERREGESAFKLNTAKLFYRLMSRISVIPIPLDTGDFRLMDRRVVEALKAMPERDRFVRGMVSWVGFKQTSVKYSRAARQAGESKYSTLKMLRFAVDGILSFSNVPLHVATFTGLAAVSLGVLAAIVTITGWLLGMPWLTGWICVLIAVFFMGGVQLISLGMVGEYLWRIYGESKRRPLYLVREMLGFEQSDHETAKAVTARGKS